MAFDGTILMAPIANTSARLSSSCQTFAQILQSLLAIYTRLEPPCAKLFLSKEGKKLITP